MAILDCTKRKTVKNVYSVRRSTFRKISEDVGREKPNILQVSICSSCHACLKDDVVMKEIREIVKKKQF